VQPDPHDWEYVVDWHHNRTRLSFVSGVSRNVPSFAPSPNVYTTIQAAYDACSSGDTVLVEDGVYHEGLHLSKNGSPGSLITIRAVTTGRAVIDPINLTTYGHVAVYIDGSYNVLQGFEIRNGARGGVSLYHDPNGSYNQILNNNIHDNGFENTLSDKGQNGIYSSDGTSYNSYNGNYVHNNGRIGDPSYRQFDHGIYVQGQNEIIANNIIKGNAYHGIQVAGFRNGPNDSPSCIFRAAVRNTHIYNNTIVSNGRSGIVLYQYMDGVDIANNIIYGQARVGIDLCDAMKPQDGLPTVLGVQIINNLFYANTVGALDLDNSQCGDCPRSSGDSVVINPTDPAPTSANFFDCIPPSPGCDPVKFVDPAGDWHVMSGSVAIGHGTSVSDVPFDYEGNPRPTPPGGTPPTGVYDIGAYQHR
jgi:hypothetical protein